MSHPSYTRANGLTPQQHLALDLVALSQSDTTIASQLGIARETVTRWRLYDDTFRAALDARRDETWRDSLAAVRALIPDALLALKDELSSSDHRGRLALDLLRSLGALTLTPPPSPDDCHLPDDRRLPDSSDIPAHQEA